MASDEQRNVCLKFLQKLKDQNRAYTEFQESVKILQSYAASKGLEDEDISLLANVIVNIDLGAAKMSLLVKCLIPRYKIPKDPVKLIINWYLSSVDVLPITLSNILMQWIIGLWDYQLIDKKVINIYYSVFFYVMLKKERLEKQIARLIYLLTKPEDVTRRDVCRLLALQRKYSKPKTHITVLLSLFKSYKPELVPEEIQSVNIENIWKPLPEVLQIMFQDAKARSEVQETRDSDKTFFKWNTFEPKRRRKTTIPLLPSVEYFQIGSNIFKEKDTTSIFDISSTEELGKSHLNIELPCNAMSLLTNTAGYHLLTFADFQYQSRFSYNLYNTLIRALILENEKFSVEEINKLLDMTVEFSRYMQQGIFVINRFLDEYLYFNTGEYQSKLLTLLQWMTSVSTDDLQEKILVHIQNMFYESTLIIKCEIVKAFKMLITNLLVNQGFKECSQTTPAPFVGENQTNNLEDIIPILTKFSHDLIISGLNIHSYSYIFLAEALSFYEEILTLEGRSNIQSFTLAPPAVIYGCFISKNCGMLSRICHLLLRYHNDILKLKSGKLRSLSRKIFRTVSIFTQDVIGTLWCDEQFKERNDTYFLRNVPQSVLKDLRPCDVAVFLNISNHYSILPYKCILNQTGLDISTKEDTMRIALHYFPSVNELLNIFHI